MKRPMIAVLIGACICLTGCSQPTPQKAADGAVWDTAWISVGNVIGVSTPDEMTPQENSDALSANGMYYATWSIGESEPYVNADGDNSQIYDAQAYLLLAGYKSPDEANEAAEEWLSMASEQYALETTSTGEYNGQEFTVITYAYTSESNPYEQGASAFGAYGNYAVSVEVSCREGFEGDGLDVLERFLAECHYAA